MPQEESENRTINQISENQYMIKSESFENQWHKVEQLFYANVWTCNCSTFLKRLPQPDKKNECKHIILTKKYINNFKINNLSKIPKPEICPKCYKSNYKKSGWRTVETGEKRQRYTCYNCQYRFILGENGFRKMKNDPRLIVDAIEMVFYGMTYRNIAKFIRSSRGVKITHTTIINWFKKYTKLINEYVKGIISPFTSEVWGVDEMVLNVKNTKKNGKGFYDWLWSVIDIKHRFIIATEISKKRRIEDAQKILNTAKKTTMTNPHYIITDSLRSYDSAILKVFGFSKVAHMKTLSLTDGFQNRGVERVHNEYRQVISTTRGLGNDKSAQEFFEAYKDYHNFCRPHSGLKDNKTPAESAGIDLKLGENKMMSLIKKSTEPEHTFATALGKRIELVTIHNENDCVRIVAKKFLQKRKWREINDILKLYKFCWLGNGKDSCWIRLKQSDMMEYF